MTRPGTLLKVLALSVVVGAAYGVFLLWGYTSVQLQMARAQGIYASAEEGMRDRVARSYRAVERMEIRYAGPDSFAGIQPHVWFVIAEVWAEARGDGVPVGSAGRSSDIPGSFFLETREGWVHVPEGAFPEVVGLGMSLFGLAGEGSPVPSHPLDAR
jgi:hypothetical protein